MIFNSFDALNKLYDSENRDVSQELEDEEISLHDVQKKVMPVFLWSISSELQQDNPSAGFNTDVIRRASLGEKGK